MASLNFYQQQFEATSNLCSKASKIMQDNRYANDDKEKKSKN